MRRRQRTIARAVGVAPESIRRWTAPSVSKRRRALVPIVVREEEHKVAELTVIAPGGYRVEGLTVSSAAALLRQLA